MSSDTVLGRGVGALLPEDGDEVAEEKYFFCDIDKIQPNPNQPRIYFDEEKLQELAESIKEKGIIQPLLVYKNDMGHYTLIAGERRLRAAKLAQQEEVPVLLVDETRHDESLQLALIENIQRQDLNPIEEAQAYARLMEKFALTQEEVGQKVGRKRSTITNTLRLLSLPENIQLDVAAGTLSEGHARVLLRIKDDAARLESVRAKIQADGLSVRATERLCSGAQTATTTKKTASLPFSANSADSSEEKGTLPVSYCKDVTAQLANHLNTHVRLVQQGPRGKIEIEYFSRDDLDRLLGMILE